MQNNNLSWLKVCLSGFLYGLTLQLAVGPIFFYNIGLTLQQSLLHGLVGSLAVGLVDLIYITLSLLGITQIAKSPKVNFWLGRFGAIVLLVLGVLFGLSSLYIPHGNSAVVRSAGLLMSFTSVFFLTIINPMTIVCYAGLFAVKISEGIYTRQQLRVFGFFVAVATVVFMSFSVLIVSLFFVRISPVFALYLNFVVAVALVCYGLRRLFGVEIKK